MCTLPYDELRLRTNVYSKTDQKSKSKADHSRTRAFSYVWSPGLQWTEIIIHIQIFRGYPWTYPYPQMPYPLTHFIIRTTD